MESISKKSRPERENGFVLVAALFASLILLALGILVIAISSQDLRGSAKVLGNKKAMMGAEAGINALTASFDPATHTAQSNVSVSTADSNTVYSWSNRYALPNAPATLDMAGYSIGGGQQWQMQVNAVTVTGRNTNYDTTTQVEIGIGFGPIEVTTMQR